LPCHGASFQQKHSRIGNIDASVVLDSTNTTATVEASFLVEFGIKSRNSRAIEARYVDASPDGG